MRIPRILRIVIGVAVALIIGLIVHHATPSNPMSNWAQKYEMHDSSLLNSDVNSLNKVNLSDTTQLRSSCAKGAADVKKVQLDPPAPDATFQSAYSKYLTYSLAVYQDCEQYSATKSKAAANSLVTDSNLQDQYRTQMNNLAKNMGFTLVG